MIRSFSLRKRCAAASTRASGERADAVAFADSGSVFADAGPAFADAGPVLADAGPLFTLEARDFGAAEAVAPVAPAAEPAAERLAAARADFGFDVLELDFDPVFLDPLFLACGMALPLDEHLGTAQPYLSVASPVQGNGQRNMLAGDLHPNPRFR
jgi:hypothetical protein